MDFAQLAVIGLVGLLGPALAWPERWHIPVVVGQITAGVILGVTGFGYLDASEPDFTFLANIGFALVMFVGGTHVPVRDPQARAAVGIGLARAALIGVVAAGAGTAVAAIFDTGHAPLFAVLIASSSAALVLPVVDSLELKGEQVTRLIAQVAVADAAGIIALPLVIQPANAGRAALGAVVVIALALGVYGALAWLIRSGLQKRAHGVSERRLFALELRVQLIILFALAAVAVSLHVSIMLAGFAFGLAVAAAGEPKRLAHQLFALTEGFFGPLFFIWVGAKLDLRHLAGDPAMIALGLSLGVVAVAVHLVPRLFGQPVRFAMMASAQVGLPVAAVTIGSQTGVLSTGHQAAIMLGALVTMAVAVLGGVLTARDSTAQVR